MSGMLKINISRDFSAYPIGRDESDSPGTNGEKFRVKFLIPALEKARSDNSVVEIDFEGVESFGSSFLEEAFGGLVRENGWTADQLRRYMKFVYSWPGYARAERQAWQYIEMARAS